jgi:hypothetical protein
VSGSYLPASIRAELSFGSPQAIKVHDLTIQENGHSRRFVYEDRDQALTRLADAITAGLDARLDEGCAGRRRPAIQFACFLPIEYR